MFGLQITKKAKKKKRPMEFSKKILVVSWISGSLIILFALWLTYMMIIKGYEGDVSIIITILGGAFAEITAGTSFYYWKAKSENVARENNRSVEMEEEIL